MATDNENPRCTTLGESDLRGRQNIVHPRRVDSLKTILHLPQTIKPTSKSPPRSSYFPQHPCSHLPLPPGGRTVIDDQRRLSKSTQGDSFKEKDEPRVNQGLNRTFPFMTPPRRAISLRYDRDKSFNGLGHRKATVTQNGLRVSKSTSHLTKNGPIVRDMISLCHGSFNEIVEESSSLALCSENMAPFVKQPPLRDAPGKFPPRTSSLQRPLPVPQPSQSLPGTGFFNHALALPDLLESLEGVASPLHTISYSPILSGPASPDCVSDSQSPCPQRAFGKVIAEDAPPPFISANAMHDKYGFLKETQHVTLDQYGTWASLYSNYTAYRRKKWVELLRGHGLQTSDLSVFPPRYAKVKRFVRKGIPSEFRGAAWFWYSGGYELLKHNPDHYHQLVRKAMASPSNRDKKQIERDLHRTFPNNLHFIQEPVITGESQPSNITTEAKMVQSLRRVLYAFALHNPKIGYTQSLNFVTGMLLLFLPEEKAFWILHIITSKYLPGAHDVSLEGADVDLWVIMALVQDSTPNIYSKIAKVDGSLGEGKKPILGIDLRLPEITLGLSNWIMSAFIGTLPVESTLRIWDVLFYEGSKTLFRASLAIFKACERDILAASDAGDVFQAIQNTPKGLLDANKLLRSCFVRRSRVGQGRIEELRETRRTAIRQAKLG